MKILFITSSRIGDAVLSTGLLNYIEKTWPEARVSIACGTLTTSLFEGYPLLERIIPIKKQKHNAHWLKLWKQTVPQRWDMVIDLRNSIVSRLIPANQRFIMGPHINKMAHKAEQNASIMNLERMPLPKLWFTKAQMERAEALIPSGAPVLAIGPTANWIGKTWPAERFVALIDDITRPGHPMEGWRVAVFAAPGEEEAARAVLSTIPPGRALDIIAKTDPGTAAATIARCAFYIGNDSGLMHCAAAVHVPTLGLFGPSWPHLYAPYGKHCGFVSTPKNFDQLTDYEGYDAKTLDRTLMEGLSVEMVITELETLCNRLKSAQNA
ncbi:MAG: glycosyltransferase family 9 protein [Alphaproteobacteria bacterium]|nr:glycosyltransferase family 9 protein [Alphaproteobacteria bacterium]